MPLVSQSFGLPPCNQSVFPAALKDIQVVEIPDLELTGWTLAGGMIDGVEMEEADIKSVTAAK